MSEPRYNLHAYFAHDLESDHHRWKKLRRWLARTKLDATIGRAPQPYRGAPFEVVLPEISDDRAVEFVALFTPVHHVKK